MNQPPTITMMSAINATLSTINPQMSTALGGIGSRSVAGSDDVYECFLLFEILEVLKSNGATSFTSQPANKPIDFRRSPGNFDTAPNKFSYITFSLNNKIYEVHVSTMVATTAIGAKCELDIAIFDSNVRNRSSLDPTYQDVKLFVEAKYYSNNIDISLAREFYSDPICQDKFLPCLRWPVCRSLSA